MTNAEKLERLVTELRKVAALPKNIETPGVSDWYADTIEDAYSDGFDDGRVTLALELLDLLKD